MTPIRGQCPTCEKGRNAQVIAEHEEKIEPTDEQPSARVTMNRILKCAGCDTVYFQRDNLEVDSVDDEPSFDFDELRDAVANLKEHVPDYILKNETIYWPTPLTKREHRDWSKLSDNILIKLLESVYTALKHDLKVLAVIGMRTVFDRASQLIGIDPNLSFAEKLNCLHREGHIGAAQKASLEALTDAGGAAAHRGWEPDISQLNTLTTFMEHFVASFVLKEDAGKLKKSIPSRKKMRRSSRKKKSSTADDRKMTAQLIDFPAPTTAKS